MWCDVVVCRGVVVWHAVVAVWRATGSGGVAVMMWLWWCGSDGVAVMVWLWWCGCGDCVACHRR